MSDQSLKDCLIHSLRRVLARLSPVQDEVSVPMPSSDRDIALDGGTSSGRQWLSDLLRLHAVAGATPNLDRLQTLLQQGKPLELAGLEQVPTPIFKGPGRFTVGERVLEDDVEIREHLTPIVKEAMEAKLDCSLDHSPYKEFLEALQQKTDSEPVVPESKDALLFPAGTNSGGSDKYDGQTGNKTVFHFATSLVGVGSNRSAHRVEAALVVLNALWGEAANGGRVLTRGPNENDPWRVVPPLEAAEHILTFVLEIFLDKDRYVDPETPVLEPSESPVPEATDNDVLFGRGGFTNVHPGNRRFRDIIALHRPDYIRAIKMDKPNVARKIVQAIRCGSPPGRFLKKAADGQWYDVGDRVASEKTSQGLRERSNAEKRQRSALREALRIRKEDLAEGSSEDNNNKGNTTVLNYLGTNLEAPLSLIIKDPPLTNTVKPKKGVKLNDVAGVLNTAGLPPNAVDVDGNILVTDYDILYVSVRIGYIASERISHTTLYTAAVAVDSPTTTRATSAFETSLPCTVPTMSERPRCKSRVWLG